MNALGSPQYARGSISTPSMTTLNSASIPQTGMRRRPERGMRSRPPPAPAALPRRPSRLSHGVHALQAKPRRCRGSVLRKVLRLSKLSIRWAGGRPPASGASH